MSRFVAEDEAIPTIPGEEPVKTIAPVAVPVDSSGESDSDEHERPTLQKQLYLARQKARKEKRRRAEAANPTLALKGRAREFYGALERERRGKRKLQRDEMEKEMGEFKRVKREATSDSSDDSYDSEIEENPVVGVIKEEEEKKHSQEDVSGGLVGYSDSDSDVV